MGYYIFLDTNHSNDAVGARLHEVPTGMITSLVPLLVANFALTQKMAIYIMSTMYPNSIKNYIYSYDQKYWSLLITTTIVFTLLLGILIFKKNKQNYFMKPFGLLYFLGKKDFFMDVFYQKIEKITIYILAKKIVSQNIEWKFIEKTITYGFFTIVSRSHHIFSFFYKNSIHYTLQAIVIMIWIFLSNTVIFFNF
jgi:hypothetical protein